MKLSPTNNFKEVHLQPGDIYFAGEQACFRTLLGSCVAITLWHPKRRIGGMCHFMLPERNHPRLPGKLDGRYADEALSYFLLEIEKSGTRPQEYEARLFGGGNMFPQMVQKYFDVPSRNIEAGRGLLLAHGFKIVAEDLGGTTHRRVMFNLADGQVMLMKG